MTKDSFYDNLLRATDNTKDITTEKYATITNMKNGLCSVREEDSELEHSNVPILNQIHCETGDKVIIGFVNNSLYEPVVTGNLSRNILNDVYSKEEINDKLNEIIEHTITFDAVYPVGSIYMSINSVNPSLLFGGTWVQLKDTFLLSAGDSFEAGSSGGEATHTLTEDEIPSHTHIQNAHNHTQNSHNHTQNSHNHTQNAHHHQQYGYYSEGTGSEGAYTYQANRKRTRVDSFSTTATNQAATATNQAATATNKEATATNQNTGGGLEHNNMPPYLTVFMWKRTA